LLCTIILESQIYTNYTKKKNDHIILIIQHASEHTGWQDEHKYEPLFLSY